MKATGIVRQVDELGRIVIPIELRRTYDLAVKDNVEIYTEDDRIILKKYQKACVFCGNSEDLGDYKGKAICQECMEDIKNK